MQLFIVTLCIMAEEWRQSRFPGRRLVGQTTAQMLENDPRFVKGISQLCLEVCGVTSETVFKARYLKFAKENIERKTKIK